VTPEGVKFAGEVDELTAPSVKGQFGVLPSHRPLLAGLKTGIVSVLQGGEERTFAVGPGFVKVADDQASITTERFMAKGDVDAVVARKDLKESQDALEALPLDADEAELFAVVAASRWAGARLELYGDPPPATVVLAQEMRLLAYEDYSQSSQVADDEEAVKPDEAAQG